MASLSPKDALLVPKLKKLGNRMPVRTILAARWAGLPVPLAAAILMQETGGGINEYGHDPTIFVGAGAVTKQNYAVYKKLRNATGKFQGVGPCQLTYGGFQDQADKIGGCWSPLANMKIGFASLANSIKRAGLRNAVVSYNGSGPAAEAYADKVLGRANTYAVALKLPAVY